VNFVAVFNIMRFALGQPVVSAI